ncbi:MAG: LacI family DNA-binding transcriptional regulator, partial [Bacillota bacterium]
MASIYEIAQEVGVSPSTVARALRGTGYCSKDNYDKIMEVAQRLNYVPSHAAKSLKSKRTNKILFLIPDIYNPFYFGMIKGASDVLDQYGYYTILCHTRGSKEMEKKMLRSLREGYGDGMIFVSFDFNRENIGEVNACGLPVVLTNNYQSLKGEDHFDCVYIDTFEGIYMSCKCFIEQGFRKIGYIGGDT